MFEGIRNKHIQIAKENHKIIKQGYYINEKDEKISLGTNHGRSIYAVDLYSPETLEEISRDGKDDSLREALYSTGDISYFLMDADSFAAARGFEKPLVMNFANAIHPGGGYLSGASAQEEALCRCSTLYASISSRKAAAMYEYNSVCRTEVDSDYMLLSPNVLVFRDEELRLLDVPMQVGVVTVAAPNRNGAARNVPLDELNRVMEDRLRNFLTIAAINGYKTLILGAWGCGAFGNDPEDVAHCFRNLLFDEHMEDLFDNIVFAILGGGRNYNAFQKVFGGELEIAEPLKPWELKMQSFEEGMQINDEDADRSVFLSDIMPVPEKDLQYIQVLMPFPVCNHTSDIGKENIGYTQGILFDGTPFEAETWEQGDMNCLSVILPVKEGFCKDPIKSQDGRCATDKGKLIGIHYAKEESADCSILPIGMAIVEREPELEEIQKYVEYIQEVGIVRFLSDLRDGFIRPLIDIEGNEVVQVIITLNEGEQHIAETGLIFLPFRDTGKNDKKRFKRVK